VHVERVVERARGDLALGDTREVGDAAVALQVEQRTQVAGLQIELGERDRALRVVLCGRERDVQRDGRAADAALGAGDGDDLPADAVGDAGEVVGLRALPDRARPGRRAPTVSGPESTSRNPARSAWRRRSGEASRAASSSSPTAGCFSCS
jgi:hypothetical protein